MPVSGYHNREMSKYLMISSKHVIAVAVISVAVRKRSKFFLVQPQIFGILLHVVASLMCVGLEVVVPKL